MNEHRELAALAASLRAYLEWQRSTGTVAIPKERVERGGENLEARVPEAAAAVPSREIRKQSATPVETSSSALPLALRDERLSSLAEEVSKCSACGLCRERQQTVFSRGKGEVGLCFIGEGPGADEDRLGAPFVGKAGQLLDRMIAAMGLGRDEVYVCNIVKCRPPKNRKPTPEEMAACMPFLEEQLRLIRPSVIVALGATAVQGLLQVSGGITRMRGSWKLYRGEIAVMPTFHPAYLLRSPSKKREVWEDLKAVLRHMGREAPEIRREQG